MATSRGPVFLVYFAMTNQKLGMGKKRRRRRTRKSFFSVFFAIMERELDFVVV